MWNLALKHVIQAFLRKWLFEIVTSGDEDKAYGVTKCQKNVLAFAM